MNIELLTRAEAQFKETLLTARGNFEERRRQALDQAPQIGFPAVSQEAQQVPPALTDAPVSASTYRQIHVEATSRELPRQRVTQAHIEEARIYVQELFDVDLSQVRVEVLPNSEWDDARAEASTFKSGTNSHLVFIPEICPCSPSELLVHELGHTGHYTAQRQTPEYMFYWANPLTVEFPAHYAQYNFILDKLSRLDFMQAMLQVVTSTYALAILKSGSLHDLDKFWMSRPAAAIREAWPQHSLLHQFKLFQENRAYFFEECRRGVSQMLALTLVDRHEEMRKFIRLDRFDRAIAPKLEEAFPEDNVTKGFPGINEQVAKLLARFSR